MKYAGRRLRTKVYFSDEVDVNTENVKPAFGEGFACGNPSR